MVRQILLISSLVAVAATGTPFATAERLTIFYNGKVFTSNETQPLIEDGGVAIRDNTIVKVGSSHDVLELRTFGAELIDLKGRTLLPGFNDAHVHPYDVFTFPAFGNGAVVVNDNSFLPLPGPSFDELSNAIRTAAQANPPGTWLMAFAGTRLLEDRSLNRLVIDAVAPDHPVLLSAWFGHGTVINTKAIQTLGLALNEPDPPGGSYGRLPNGELSGEVREYAEHRIRRFFSEQMTDQQLVNAYESYTRFAAQAGYTTLQAFAVGIPQSRHLAILRKADMPIRVRAHCFPLSLDEPCDVPADFSPDRPFAMKYSGGDKWIDDGTPIERFSLLRNDYEDDPGNAGRPNFPDVSMQRQLDRATRGPLPGQRDQILVHQTGDALADKLFVAQQRANDSRIFWRARRPRLEHGTVLQPDQIDRAAEWGWVVVTNPLLYSLADIFHARLGPDQEAAVWPTRSLLKAGVPLAIGSDAATAIRGPFVDLLFAQINPSNPSEAVSLQEAVIAYTRGSAYAEFKEDAKGSLAPGKAADLVVIDQDIFDLDPPEQILATRVLLTMVNGKIVHKVAGELDRR